MDRLKKSADGAAGALSRRLSRMSQGHRDYDYTLGRYSTALAVHYAIAAGKSLDEIAVMLQGRASQLFANEHGRGETEEAKVFLETIEDIKRKG